MKMTNQVKIHAGTRIKTLLDVDSQGVINELVKLNLNFSKLKNPILRRVFASRVTIADACKIANCKVDDFLKSMSRIGFVLITAIPAVQKSTQNHGIDFSRHTHVVELDARPYLKNHHDPLKEILVMVNKLNVGDRLKITNTFEPVPLISLLTDKGFSYVVEYIDVATVITWFEKQHDGNVTAENAPIPQTVKDQELFNMVLQRFDLAKVRYVDVRELQMPQPMMLIMENLETLPADHLLFVHHKKVPVFLLPELHKKGMTFLLNHKSADEVDMLIYQS
ncbi:DUF2249 domain-containing protein [Pedobacter immunditicola]|uniref:DUF2249 domain-containing protein n=1 Tax=Pedobacter immunditicola TaxID=3133440 RepID=UPI0030B5BAE1